MTRLLRQAGIATLTAVALSCAALLAQEVNTTYANRDSGNGVDWGGDYDYPGEYEFMDVGGEYNTTKSMGGASSPDSDYPTSDGWYAYKGSAPSNIYVWGWLTIKKTSDGTMLTIRGVTQNPESVMGPL